MRNIESNRVNKNGKERSQPGAYFGHKQVMDVMDNVVTIHFEKPFELDKGVTVEFIPAGHILGAASIKVTVSEKGNDQNNWFYGRLR